MKRALLITALFLILISSQGFAIHATYTVTNCADSDTAGTLRWAISQAESAGGNSEIIFDITTQEASYSSGESYSGLVTTEAATSWFRIIINSALPTISVSSVNIQGSTQTREATNDKKVELRSKSGGGINCITITGNNCTVEGLVINGFSGSDDKGIVINGGGSNVVSGCYLGISATGEAAYANYYGIYIYNGASYNIVGGNTSAEGNVISGNTIGVFVSGTLSHYNILKNNTIGLNWSRTSKIPNTDTGVKLDNTYYNKIGESAPGRGNTIAGNDTGIDIVGALSTTNEVLGNFIGTTSGDATGLGNTTGIRISVVPNNKIGDGTDNGRNIISGNTYGIYLVGGCQYNEILGNYIGTTSSGEAALANDYGIFLSSNPKYNKIGNSTGGGNVISGNIHQGIYIIGSGTASNEVLGNYIGTNKNGTAGLGNGSYGIYILGGANRNRIGDGTLGGRNILSNNATGVYITENDTNSNEVLGNYIGTNKNGTAGLGNGGCGIGISWGARYNKIGNDIGGGNVISGNGEKGIFIFENNSNYNEILGNYIGTTASGEAAIPNTQDGIRISGLTGTCGYNRIGNGSDGGRNVISGNSLYGINFESNANSNEVSGNYIGTGAGGSSTGLGNSRDGVYITGSSDNRIGSTTASYPNIISGNTWDGIDIYNATSNEVLGNYIGTDALGTVGLGNHRTGVRIDNGSKYNKIGNGTGGGKNVISRNTSEGILIKDPGTDSNQVLGNYIGTTASGEASLGNGLDGVTIRLGAQSNIVGDGNVISGNSGSGVRIYQTGTGTNEVRGNYIGVGAGGTTAIGNTQFGVYLSNDASNNRIGPANIIANSILLDGVCVDGASTFNNLITQNSIYSNAGKGITLVSGANHGIGTPEVTSFTIYQYGGGGDWLHLTGTATSFAHIELFGPDPNGQGAQYQGSVEADALGNWGGDSYNTGCATNAAIVVTQTATLTGDTSEFSSPKLITLLTYQPDNMIGTLESGTDYFYPNVFESTPATQIKAQAMGTTEAATYYFKVINTGSPEVIIITGEAGGGLFTVKYYDSKTATHEITSDMTGAGFLASLESNASVEGMVELRYSGSVNVTKDLTLTAVSTHDAGKVDVVLASTTFYATPYQPDVMIATLESGADYILEGPPYETIPVVQVRTRSVASNEAAVFYFKLKNAGSLAEKIRASAEAGSGNFTVKYYGSKTGTDEITSDITAPGGVLSPLEIQPGSSAECRAEITYSGNTIATKEIVFTTASSHDAVKIDAVKGIITFVPLPPPTPGGHADHFTAVFPGSAIAGVPFAVTLNALNAAGSPETNVTVITYVSVDSGTISPPSIEASGFVSGVWSGNITLGRPGLRIVTVTQTGCVTMTAEVLTYNATQEYTNPAIPGLKITIPSGATSSDVTVTASIVTDPSSGRTPAGFSIGGSVIEIGPSGTVFLIPVTVIIPISGPLADPRVYYWNGSTWSSDGITIISVTDTLLTFTTTHFTPFAPMGALPDNYVRFAPNPYNPNNGSGRFWYWLDANADTSVYIIDLGGTLVWKRSFSSGVNGGKKDGNNIEFDGKTAWGDVLGNGVYLYKIVQDGKSIGGGKIAVIK